MPPRRLQVPTETVAAIAEELSDGASIAQTARRYHLSEYLVRRIGVDAGVMFNGPGRPTIHITSPRNPSLDGLFPQWAKDAACAGVPDYDHLFFPQRADPESARAAKAICARCPVRQECLEYALDIGEGHGIWGGLTAYQRRHLLTHRTTRTVSQEGTPA